MQQFLEFLFDLFTLSRKHGPLLVRVEHRPPHVHLILENDGRRKLAFAAVRCRDGDGKHHFPKAELAAGTVLHPGRPETLTLAASELRSLDCRLLEVLDTTGLAWPVEDYHAAVLGRPPA